MTKDKNMINEQQFKKIVKWVKLVLTLVFMVCLLGSTDSLWAFVVLAISWVVLTVIGFKEKREVMKWLLVCDVVLSVLALVLGSVIAVIFNNMAFLVSAIDVSIYCIYSSLFWYIALYALLIPKQKQEKKGEWQDHKEKNEEV